MAEVKENPGRIGAIIEMKSIKQIIKEQHIRRSLAKTKYKTCIVCGEPCFRDRSGYKQVFCKIHFRAYCSLNNYIRSKGFPGGHLPFDLIRVWSVFTSKQEEIYEYRNCT